MIPTPFKFDINIAPEQFQKIGRFACRWAYIEHTIGNCLRTLLAMSPEHATAMIFPLSLDLRMARIGAILKRTPLEPNQMALYEELKPLVRAMQYLRTTALHGVIVDLFPDEEPFFHLRSKGRLLNIGQVAACEDLINYTGHISIAFRLSLGGKEDDRGPHYTLPDRPPIPDFLPDDCQAFHQTSTGGQISNNV